jgi:hypothetical protein
LTHCWVEIRKCPKWDAIYEAYKKENNGNKRDNESSVVDLEEAAASEGPSGSRVGRTRDHKASKQDVKSEANAIALQATLKGLMAEKEVSSERKCKEKEQQLKSFMDF